MSKLTFLHKVTTTHISGDKKVVHEENIIEGPKGFSAKYFHKEGDVAEKIIIVKQGSEYLVRTEIDGKKDEKKVTTEELLKFLTKNKDLKYISDYIKSHKGGVRRLSRRKSKRNSRKSKKLSKRRKSKSKSKRSRVY